MSAQYCTNILSILALFKTKQINVAFDNLSMWNSYIAKLSQSKNNFYRQYNKFLKINICLLYFYDGLCLFFLIKKKFPLTLPQLHLSSFIPYCCPLLHVSITSNYLQLSRHTKYTTILWLVWNILLQLAPHPWQIVLQNPTQASPSLWSLPYLLSSFSLDRINDYQTFLLDRTNELPRQN